MKALLHLGAFVLIMACALFGFTMLDLASKNDNRATLYRWIAVVLFSPVALLILANL